MKRYVYFFVVLLFIQACKNQSPNDTPSDELADTKTQNVVTDGMIAYSIRVSSPDSNNIRIFYDFNPEKINLYFKGEKFRMIESGGLSKGNILLDNSSIEVFQLDTANKIAYKGVYSDLASAHAQLQKVMPDHYAPTIEDAQETDTILGYACKKYKVIKSGFTRAQNATFIWVTDSVIFPSARYDIETEINAVTTPVPVLIGYRDGLIMRMAYTADNMDITYEISELNTNFQDEKLFVIPDNYEIR